MSIEVTSPTSSAVAVTVLVLDSPRTDSATGGKVEGLLREADHPVVAVQVVDADGLDAKLAELSRDDVTQAVVLCGGTGLGEGVGATLVRRMAVELPGYGELFRRLAYELVGAAAMLSRPVAGIIDQIAVFTVPGTLAGSELALRELVLPVLTAVVAESHKALGAPETGIAQLASAPAPARKKPAAAVGGPVARSSGGFQMGASQDVTQPVDDPEADDYEPDNAGGDDEFGLDIPDRGWQRAVHDLGGRVLTRSREDLPMNIESLAPVVNVLETSGEQAVLKLGSGARFSIWGWPDLQRPDSKVIAVGWGEPLAEVIALHRFPRRHGTIIEERRALVMDQQADVAKVAREVTGRAPTNTDGVLFAVDNDEVWILRGSRVYKWDGKRERDDGSPKQVLATLVLRWSQK